MSCKLSIHYEEINLLNAYSLISLQRFCQSQNRPKANLFTRNLECCRCLTMFYLFGFSDGRWKFGLKDLQSGAPRMIQGIKHHVRYMPLIE